MLRRLFSSNRRSIAPLGTLVFLRTGSVCRASATSCRSRSLAAVRFAFCVLCRCETTRITPSLLARVASRSNIRFFAPSERTLVLATSNRTVTRVLTLFTFCPPGPELRELLNTSSSCGISIIPQAPFDIICAGVAAGLRTCAFKPVIRQYLPIPPIHLP